jgi:hypothetical protein
MSLPRLASSSNHRYSRGPDHTGHRAAPRHRHGHAHFWQRALSRRQVVRTASGLAIAGLGLGRAGHLLAQEGATATPKPIPGGIDLGGGQLIHVYDYSPGWEPSTITDFLGMVGINHLRTEGTVTKGGGNGGLNPPTATGDRLSVDVDMRFMQGTYVGEDGQTHQGTFGFV